jgi:hypothetical protein
MNNFIAKTFDNILEQEDVDQLISYCNTTDKWRVIAEHWFWHNRTINYLVINEENKNLGSILEKIIKKTQKLLIEEYKLEDPIYADTLDLVRWFPGMKQEPHCDDMSDNKDVHSAFQHRYFGCVLYLNENYVGGHTYYPQHNFSIKPKTGTLAVHLGDCNHRHGVTKIENNIRYTVASFWTFDKTRAIQNINWE